jgi:membrane protease YdiL (CAAX protease family)
MATGYSTDSSGSRASQSDAAVQGTWLQTLVKVFAGFLPLFLILQFGPDLLLRRVGQFWALFISAGVMLLLALGVEMLLFFNNRPLQALRQLGYGRPAVRPIVVALLLSGVMLLFFPLLSLITGVRLGLNSGWVLTLVSIVVFNGLAEETLFRGYVFGHLRQKSTFLRAGLISLLFFAAAHLFLFLRNPFAIALAGTLVAVTAAFPMAFLFERGNHTIWAPVVLHVATHAIRLVSIPEAVYMTAVLAWLVMQIFLPLLVFAFRRYLKDEGAQ